MISTAEAKVQRRVTDAFIAADYITLSLTRPVFVSDGAGGEIEGAPATVRPQRFRMVPQQDAGLVRTTADGSTAQPSYRLIGAYDADVKRWDRFTHNGAEYEIVFVLDSREYETKAEVVYLG